MSELTFTTRGIAEVIDSQQKIAAAIGGPKAAAMQLQQQWRDNQTEIRNLERIAKQVMRETESAEDKYKRKLGEAKLALEGKTDAAKTLAAYERKLRDEAKGAGDAMKSGFGVDVMAQYVSGFISVGGAVSALAGFLADVDANAKKASDRLLNAVGSLGELQQLASSPQDFLKLLGQTRNLVSTGVFSADQEAAAADLVFALRSAGYDDSEVAFITGLGQSKQVKPENLEKVAQGLKKYQDVFGKQEAGSIPGIANKVYKAASSMQTDFGTAAEASTLFGSEAGALGYSDEEALGAFVAIEKKSPGTREAATRLRSLLTQIAKKPELNAGSFKKTVDALVGRVHSGEQAIGIVGEQEAAAALNILAEAGGYKSFVDQTAAITAAQGQDLIGASQYVTADPRLRAAVARQRTQGALDSGREERQAALDSYIQAFGAEVANNLEGQGRGWASWFNRAYLWTADKAGAERTVLREGVFGDNGSLISPELRKEIQDYLISTAPTQQEKSQLETLQQQQINLLQQQLQQSQQQQREMLQSQRDVIRAINDNVMVAGGG